MTTFRHQPPPSLDDPYADEWTRPFWDHATQETLSAQQCSGCGAFRMPPGRICPKCHGKDFHWPELPGTGTLYSFIVVRHPLRPDMADYVPYVPAVVEADGAPGCRFITNVVDVALDDIECDMPLRVVWNHVNDRLVLPFWTQA